MVPAHFKILLLVSTCSQDPNVNLSVFSKLRDNKGDCRIPNYTFTQWPLFQVVIFHCRMYL